MEYKHPKSVTHSTGIYGGIGTRQAHEAWTPSETDKGAPGEPVPRRFRRVRVQRTRPRRMLSDKAHQSAEFFVFMVCAAFAVITILIITGVLHLRLK